MYLNAVSKRRFAQNRYKIQNAQNPFIYKNIRERGRLVLFHVAAIGFWISLQIKINATQNQKLETKFRPRDDEVNKEYGMRKFGNLTASNLSSDNFPRQHDTKSSIH